MKSEVIFFGGVEESVNFICRCVGLIDDYVLFLLFVYLFAMDCSFLLFDTAVVFWDSLL